MWKTLRKSLFFILRRIIVIHSGNQNHSNTWGVLAFVGLYVFIVAFEGIQRRRTWKWNQRWDFVDWQDVSHCSSNEGKFHMHWSYLNIFLRIIVHITPKKPKLHSKQCLRSINVQNTDQCDHLLFGQPKLFVVYLLLWGGFLITSTNNACYVYQHFCLRYHWKLMNTLYNIFCLNNRTMKKKAQLSQKLLMRTRIFFL